MTASWADQFNTYTDACEFYGADTPASLRIEMEWRDHEAWVEWQDAIEARGGPKFTMPWRDEF